MKKSSTQHKSTPKKPGLHHRNPHNSRYDFSLLCQKSPELKTFLSLNPVQETTINFSDPAAVKALNQALLKQFYNVAFWDIPPGFLCPAIPGRADYIHHLADLLAISNNSEIPRGKQIRGLDIGMGANCVYPIIGSQSYGWSFVGSDINSVALNSAQQMISFNKNLKSHIQCRHQKSEQHIFKNIIKDNDLFDISLCNPPFHASAADAAAGTERKQRNLSKHKTKQPIKPLNFGGQNNELWCKGGEISFLKMMINESVLFSQQCLWFTSLVSKKENLAPLQKALKKAGAKNIKVLDMAQGQKVSRILAWSFLDHNQQQLWAKQWK